MHQLTPIYKIFALFCIIFLVQIGMTTGYAQQINFDEEVSIDRIQLVKKQIEMLQSRQQQAENEYTILQEQHEKQITEISIGRASKSRLDRASLDVSVGRSNLDSLTIELADAQQTVSWLEKNIQEIKNQLNILGMFGLKTRQDESIDVNELREDLHYQKELLQLEKTRVKLLQSLNVLANNLLQLKKEKHRKILAYLKINRLMSVKQQQVQDELAYQQQQNYWLQKLNKLYDELSKIDPVRSKQTYLATERSIFYVNENANFAYAQSLIARYRDQIQQMKLAVYKSTSISVLNEISDQVAALNKQIIRLDTGLKTRAEVMEKHISYLQRKKEDASIQDYLQKLATIKLHYTQADIALKGITKDLAEFRITLEKALQVELSSRQGFPTFGFKMLLDLGKEMLLVPALAYHMLKSLSGAVLAGVKYNKLLDWCLLAVLEMAFIFSVFSIRKFITHALQSSSEWRGKINSKWLSLQWLQHNFIEFMVLANLISVMAYLGVPVQNYLFIIYVSFVWIVFKSIMTILRVCLVEATHDATGHDVRLYKRLKWIILIGGLITASTVFMHQLPLIYELKILFDRLFLFFLMIASFLLLRSWEVVPKFVLSYMELPHPYFIRCVRLISFLVPLLLLGNSIIGLLGYVNLVMTVSSHEGIFMMVLIGYLILRGLLSDGMEQISRLVIQYVQNGWLWTEAFLKPIDRVLRITLFLVGWAVLFILYGWDKQSPIVERLYRLMNHKLANVLNTAITPLGIIEVFVVISVFYWTAKWTREFVYRLLLSRSKDMGLSNTVAILSQYSVVVACVLICLRILGIDYRALTFVFTAFAFGVGLGLRDLANNFACGFLILLERPLRVGDIVNVSGTEGEVTNIGGRAVTIRTWDRMELVVPNAEIFNKAFTNWTAKDNIVRCVVDIKINRHDNPHSVKQLIHDVLATRKEIVQDPVPEVYLKNLDDVAMDFEIRYFVNIRQVTSRISVISSVLMNIWDVFAKHGIKPPYPKQELFISSGNAPKISFLEEAPAIADK